MFSGISMIARFELDPIAREIYVTRDKRGRLMTIVGLDGWVKILDRVDHYDGFDVQIGPVDDQGHAEWIETRIYSTKRSHPAVYRAFASEYAKMGGFVAGAMPLHMLRIFSLRHAARLFTPLGATCVTPEEAEWLDRTPAAEEARAEHQLSKAEQLAASLQSHGPEEEPDPDDTADEPVPFSEPEQEPATKPQEAPLNDRQRKAATMAAMKKSDALALFDAALQECRKPLEIAAIYNEWVEMLPQFTEEVDAACTARHAELKGR